MEFTGFPIDEVESLTPLVTRQAYYIHIDRCSRWRGHIALVLNNGHIYQVLFRRDKDEARIAALEWGNEHSMARE